MKPGGNHSAFTTADHRYDATTKTGLDVGKDVSSVPVLLVAGWTVGDTRCVFIDRFTTDESFLQEQSQWNQLFYSGGNEWIKLYYIYIYMKLQKESLRYVKIHFQ